MAYGDIEADERLMRRALELARQGEGRVEPNPMVGCVVAREGQVVAEGWHRRFGGPHAEIDALAAAGDDARGATVYVTLEPCAHTGKTAPCTSALIAAGVSRVVVAQRDPNPHVAGGGCELLRASGIECEIGVCSNEAAALVAPFAKLVTTGRPWVIAKWAMSLDGKIATHSGDSRWISGEPSRARVHQLRGRVDAVIVGAGTALHDDPLLTARPPGPRTPLRIVMASASSPPALDRLAASTGEGPVMLAVTRDTPREDLRTLADRGVEIWQSQAVDRAGRWLELLDELGRRQMTNVLVEGGAAVFGALLDADSIDELHAFIAPILIGGDGLSPVAGGGTPLVKLARRMKSMEVKRLGEDVYVHGRFR